tara:strand:- start:6401 stop:6646 length:246 start_codon:yes stop_codon:yes gene_type:complete
VNQSELRLYTAQNCHLCEVAEDLLQPLLEQQHLILRKVDIGVDADLKAAYGLRIPVVVLPNGVEKGWPFTAIQVKRLLVSV